MKSLSELQKEKYPELYWLDNITKLMDSKFQIPFTKIRFGLDPIIGLIPYGGDLVSFGISGLIVLSMARRGASSKLVIKMLANVLIDAIASIFPIIGDVFDLFYKANRRNYHLLREHYTESKHTGNALIPILVAVVGLFIIIFLFFYLVYLFGSKIYDFLVNLF